MNKYIESDIEQGLKYLKVGIMNALAALESGEEDDITLNGQIAVKFIIDCAEERGWVTDPDMDGDWTNGWELDYWYRMVTPNDKLICISGSILCGNSVNIHVDYSDE